METVELVKYPITLEDFLKEDIPEVEYIIKPVLPRQGKLLISAHQGSCKTFLALNLACAIASGLSPYLQEIEIKQAKVLCILGEGGEAELRRRLDPMANRPGINTQNLVLDYNPSLDLASCESREILEKNVANIKPEVLILEPIGQLWAGNEIDKEEVRELTKYLDSLIDKYYLTLIITHHWKKPSRDISSGGQMASGSYWWTAWVDGHITLKGKHDNLTLAFDKVRSGIKPDEGLIIRLREEDFWLEYIRGVDNKINDRDLDCIFSSFGQDEVKLVDLASAAETKGVCVRNTLEKAIRQSTKYKIDKTKTRCFYVSRVREA